MDREDRIEALIRRNRALLSRAAEARVASQEAVAKAQQVVYIAMLCKIDRERRREALKHGAPAAGGQQ